MAYDEDLAARIRDLIGHDADLTEKKMFGGLAFLIRGHMAISASGQGGVLVHVDPGLSDDLVATTAATTAVMQGREMPGWLRVGPEDLASDDELSRWVDIGVGHARSLPLKRPAKKLSPVTAADQPVADRADGVDRAEDPPEGLTAPDPLRRLLPDVPPGPGRDEGVPDQDQHHEPARLTFHC
jgi:hypothetical protein